MMVAPALHMGIEIKVLAETPDSPAAIAATLVGDYTRLDEVLEFAKTVDVVTFDHEHVPLAVLRAVEDAGFSVQPPSKALAFAQNKLHMRQRLTELGLPMPMWREIRDASSLDDFIAANGGVAILKTPIGGYDGKGVRVVHSAADATDWLSVDGLAKAGGSLLAEEKVDFVRELAQLSARRPSGQWAAWPLVETVQRNGVCAEVIAPAPNADLELLDQAAAIARGVADGLGVTGVLAVEMFQTADGRLVINELAMRPHNSGHFSIEGAVTSQFENHVRAVLDLPLGSTDLVDESAIMINLLGVNDSSDIVGAYAEALKSHPRAKVHHYGKSPRAGRKLGHVTVVGPDAEAALAEGRSIAGILLA